MKQATSREDNPDHLSRIVAQRIREGILLVNMALAFGMLIALITYSSDDPGWSSTGVSDIATNAGGRIGAWFADLILYTIGYCAYFFPFMFAYAAIAIFREGIKAPLSYHLLILRAVGFLLVLLAGAGLASLHLVGVHYHIPFTAGGIIGDVVSGYFVQQLNVMGATLLLLALLSGGLTWFAGISWIALFKNLCAKGMAHPSVQAMRDFSLRTWATQRWYARKERKQAQISQLLPEKENARVKVEKVKKEPRIEPRIEPVFEQSVSAPVSTPPKAIKPVINKTISAPKMICTSGTQLPALDLLSLPAKAHQPGLNKTQLELRSQEVEQKLRDFGVVAHVVAVHPGPVITRYELELAPGVKASRLTNIARDLARSLSMVSVRVVEIIPGKSVVGLELPNEVRDVVTLREILQSSQYQQVQSPLSLGLGKDIAGHPVVVDLAKMPHLLVAGTTGSGKSVGVNAMLLGMLYKALPTQVRFILVDPKMLELSVYEGIPHLLAPVVTDMKQAANALRWCVAEMERRYRLMSRLGVRNLAGFNQKVQDALHNKKPIPDPLAPNIPGQEIPTLETLPFIVVIVDEFADMMMVVGKKVEQLIARLAQKARAAGIHLILATQRPSVDVITGLIKANIPTRISFQVSSRIDSRTVLDQQGAEQLLGHGDMLYLAPGSGVPVRVHGAFVSDEEVHAVVNALKELGPPDYLTDILDGTTDEGESSGSNGGYEADIEADSLYDEAVKFVTSTRRASTSSVQRRFKIGYNRAARLIEQMEKTGIVSAMESNGSREVLAPPAPED